MPNVTGTNGSETLSGSNKEDTITGLLGNDSLYAGFGADLVYGGDGNDFIFDGWREERRGQDTFYGGSGNDVLNGCGGGEFLFGGSGRDVMISSILSQNKGINTFTGGPGADLFYHPGEYGRSYNGGERFDIVTDFNIAAGDQIVLRDLRMNSFLDLKPYIFDVGSDIEIRLPLDNRTQTLVIKGIDDLSQLTAQQFRFEEVPNASTTKSSAEIFASQGQLNFMATLASAAYSLADDEVSGPEINDPAPRSDAILRAISSDVSLLSYYNLTADAQNSPLKLDIKSSGNFPRFGLEDGIFTNRNAAALVARSTDALFISFRGTNDNLWASSDSAIAGDTPDKAHWLPGWMGNHFRLFDPLIAALRAYADDPLNGIQKVFVVGHSLGAAMVEALMDRWNSNLLQAFTFASPGYGVGDGSDDTRITNLWISDDPILGASPLRDNEGDFNVIHHNLKVGENIDDVNTLHSIELYQAFVRFFSSNGIQFNHINQLRNGVEYGEFYANVEILSENARDFSIGTGDDVMLGMINNDLMLGGNGSDLISGFRGRDYLVGGIGNDTIIGGWGRDVMIGGKGLDVFEFNSALDISVGSSRASSDMIQDFGVSGMRDVIDLQTIDARPSRADPGNQAFIFIGRQEFTGLRGELRYTYDGNRTLILGDQTGDSVDDFVITLTGVHTLAESDFIL